MRWQDMTHDLELVMVDWEIDLPLQTILVANALWARDLTAADPEHRTKLEGLWGLPPAGDHWPLSMPYRCWQDPPGTWHTEGVSGCGITYDGIAERSGVAWPWLGQPYHPGTAVARDEQCARREQLANSLGQWQSCPTPSDTTTRPAAGDGVIIGDGLATHVLMACWWEGDTLVSVDGGQANAEDRFLQSIRMCRRQWHQVNGVWHLGSRPVHGWVRTSSLPWQQMILAPEGWAALELP